MIYLDYAANTPTSRVVLNYFDEMTTAYLANPNASHALGRQALKAITEGTERMAELLGVKADEIIFTSGASEANNLAVKGTAAMQKKYGRHIITTYLEHASVTNPIAYLGQVGYEVDFVDLLPDGSVDLEHLAFLLREDTILVSINAVDSEMGIIQPLEKIAELVHQKAHALFHVDAVQAIGKIDVPIDVIDLLVFAPHKFYGLNGSGVLIKKAPIHLEPIIHGGGSLSPYRSGTPTLGLNLAAVKALEEIKSIEKANYKKVSQLNQLLREKLETYQAVQINSPKHASPYILNISIKGIKGSVFQEALSEKAIYVATKSACTQAGTTSRPVYAVTKDRKRALSTLRISLSHLTTETEIQCFLEAFETVYKNLVQ